MALSNRKPAVLISAAMLVAGFGCALPDEKATTPSAAAELGGGHPVAVGVPYPKQDSVANVARPTHRPAVSTKKGKRSSRKDRNESDKLLAAGKPEVWKPGDSKEPGSSKSPPTDPSAATPKDPKHKWKVDVEPQHPHSRAPQPGSETITSETSDPATDAEGYGNDPRYAEITAASITGYAKKAVFSLTFAGRLPKKTPGNETVMSVSFGLDKKNEGVSVNASSDKSGWRANVNGGSSFPGTLSISGDTLSMSLPWKALGGKGGFSWYADSSWTRSTHADTYYSFDSAPNEQPKAYP